MQIKPPGAMDLRDVRHNPVAGQEDGSDTRLNEMPQRTGTRSSGSDTTVSIQYQSARRLTTIPAAQTALANQVDAHLGERYGNTASPRPVTITAPRRTANAWRGVSERGVTQRSATTASPPITTRSEHACRIARWPRPPRRAGRGWMATQHMPFAASTETSECPGQPLPMWATHSGQRARRSLKASRPRCEARRRLRHGEDGLPAVWSRLASPCARRRGCWPGTMQPRCGEDSEIWRRRRSW